MCRKRQFIIGGICLVIWLTSCQSGPGDFGPELATTTALPLNISYRPQPVSFSELNSDPATYRDQLIQVTGGLRHQTITPCVNWRGPRAIWSLISEGLRLDAVGHEGLIRYVPADTLMTVSGYWRLHTGPMGCGKQSLPGTLWYLEVDRLLDPNPLPLQARPVDVVVSVTPDPALTPVPGGTVPFTATVPGVVPPPIGPPPTMPPLLTPTTLPQATPTTTPFLPGDTPTVAPTVTVTTATATPTPRGGVTPSVTPTGTLSPPPTDDGSGLPTSTPGTPAPTFTATSDAYPGVTDTPTPSPTFTNTPPGYP